MEKLKKPHEKFLKALHALERTIKYVSTKNLSAEESQIYIAGLIKHFELCYEMCWKFLQAILHQQYAIELSSPKAIFRECFTHQIIGQTETQELLDMAEARNATTHNYNEETAKEICKRITHYFEIFKQLDKLGI